MSQQGEGRCWTWRDGLVGNMKISIVFFVICDLLLAIVVLLLLDHCETVIPSDSFLVGVLE